jgi:uncharacterized membrane protein YeaQ/YmgE (transglycosylase-associated protein family)
MAGLGWILTIIVGGIAGFIAEKIMNADMGILANVAVGILGAVGLNAILMLLGFGTLGGVIGQTIIAVIGACALIALYRAVKGQSATTAY